MEDVGQLLDSCPCRTTGRTDFHDNAGRTVTLALDFMRWIYSSDRLVSRGIRTMKWLIVLTAVVVLRWQLDGFGNGFVGSYLDFDLIWLKRG